jgi:hypothetical protein
MAGANRDALASLLHYTHRYCLRVALTLVLCPAKEMS